MLDTRNREVTACALVKGAKGKGSRRFALGRWRQWEFPASYFLQDFRLRLPRSTPPPTHFRPPCGDVPSEIRELHISEILVVGIWMCSCGGWEVIEAGYLLANGALPRHNPLRHAMVHDGSIIYTSFASSAGSLACLASVHSTDLSTL